MSTASHAAYGNHPSQAHHFESIEQQQASAKLGMWVFIAHEILLFAGLFLAFFAFRIWYPAGFADANQALSLSSGAIASGLLLFGSMASVTALRCAQTDKPGMIKAMAALPALFGVGFVIIKIIELSGLSGQGLLPFMAGARDQFNHAGLAEGARVFFGLHFVATILMLAHVVVGIGLSIWTTLRAVKGQFSSSFHAAVANTGLYWHLLAIVWLFTFSLFYLAK